MAYSQNDSAADSLAVTLETLEEAKEKCETDEEREAVQEAANATQAARQKILKREAPTPTQQLVEHLSQRSE